MNRIIPSPLQLRAAVARWAIAGLLLVVLFGERPYLASSLALGQTSAVESDAGSKLLLDASGPELIESIETILMQVIADSERSVVAISRVRNDQAPRSPLDSLRLGPSLPLTSDPTSEDFIPAFFGSGIVISEDGLIVTCAHVLDDPRKHNYYVWLDRRCYDATVVSKSAQVLAADPFSDLAVLKINASGLKTLPRANDPPRKGQLVIALGNPNAIARDGQASASWGMISNINRFAPRESEPGLNETIHQLGTLIQTDLRMTNGTSGGALVNWRGQLVGLTTNLLAVRGHEQAAGLAIATDEFFERVVDSLKQGKQPEFGFLGIQPDNLRVAELDRGLSGARVSMVIPGMPGSKAGLREGDIISQVGGAHVGNRNDLFRELSKVATGGKAQLKVHRSRGANWQVLIIEAELAKKYLATNRPAYSLHGPPIWRGAQVEYQSAIAGELERIAVVRDGPKVAMLNVAPDSPVWRAGLRAGYGLVSFNGQAIETPSQFHNLAGQAPGKVTLVAIASDGKLLTVVVDPQGDATP